MDPFYLSSTKVKDFENPRDYFRDVQNLFRVINIHIKMSMFPIAHIISYTYRILLQ